MAKELGINSFSSTWWDFTVFPIIPSISSNTIARYFLFDHHLNKSQISLEPFGHRECNVFCAQARWGWWWWWCWCATFNKSKLHYNKLIKNYVWKGISFSLRLQLLLLSPVGAGLRNERRQPTIGSNKLFIHCWVQCRVGRELLLSSSSSKKVKKMWSNEQRWSGEVKN